MKKINELSSLQMKEVTGGRYVVKSLADDQGGGHCFVDGETIFECMCTNDQQCKNVYGPSAICWV